MAKKKSKPTSPHTRGVLLEEIVLYLLEKIGYRIIDAVSKAEGTKIGKSGLEVLGRGESHQIDALAAYDYTPAFMYPLRLLVEAKCYKSSNTVKIETVRNSVGVLKDISENYFSKKISTSSDEIKLPRFNYQSAIFSTSGFSRGAQAYAIAHQIFLIQYSRNGLLKKAIDDLLKISDRYISASATLKSIREDFRASLKHGGLDVSNSFTKHGKEQINSNIIRNVKLIKGSYFGMLQGMWPMHLLSSNPLPPELFKTTDKINCRVYGYDADCWSFLPIGVDEGEQGWFRLEFELPTEIAELVSKFRHDPEKIASIKQKQFSYIDLAGEINGIQRRIRLEMDQPWIDNYISRMRRRKNK